MAQRSFKLDDDLDARLVAEAERQGRSVSNLIVRLLDTYVTGYEQESPKWESPGVSAQRMADEASKKGLDKQAAPEYRKPPPLSPKLQAELGKVEGTPLPKIAPRRQAK